jgi:hypothetical protein
VDRRSRRQYDPSKGEWAMLDLPVRGTEIRHVWGGAMGSANDVQKAAGHRDPGTTKLYDRRGYNPEKAVATY